jgi:hypothetical protein
MDEVFLSISVFFLFAGALSLVSYLLAHEENLQSNSLAAVQTWFMIAALCYMAGSP